MAAVFAKHLPYEDGYLASVVFEMRTQGAPTIRVIEAMGNLYALEGSHRLAAAHYLGLVPKFVAEIPELEDYAQHHWIKVAETLPEYRLDSALLLDLKLFADG